MNEVLASLGHRTLLNGKSLWGSVGFKSRETELRECNQLIEIISSANPRLIASG